MPAQKIDIREFHHDRAMEFVLNYRDQRLKESLDSNGHIIFESVEVPALFFSEYSNNFVVIEQRRFTNYYSIIKGSHIFRVVLEYGEIVTFNGYNIGEGMARAKEIILGNGDSPEWTRLDFETYTNEGKIVKSFIDVAIGKQSRIFDFQLKCWFISTDVVKPLVEGIKSLISQGTLKGYIITDERETIEAFEDFFNASSKEQSYQSTPQKPLAALKSEFITICAQAQVTVDVEILNLDKKEHIRAYYRKAAYALHPDRNNGNGSRMSELNTVWDGIQSYL